MNVDESESGSFIDDLPIKNPIKNGNVSKQSLTWLEDTQTMWFSQVLQHSDGGSCGLDLMSRGTLKH